MEEKELENPKAFIRYSQTIHFIMEILNRRKLQHTTSNHSADIEFKDLMKLCKDCTKEPFPFLVNDRTLLSINPLKFRKNLL